ncbi:FusB/FusC family EF-G-binding protein [Bacillus sp. AFS055030]|uniref:FusB/FusC family EF-G-binding protein n=1 Tax=Bacillus sp. AFS055030 TaxID=2033507 RepID=UPI000BFB1974|nr:FusB/FusC family EF-G-binding protein [Bacillus sp. AFS055030]PGL72211.1 elongation factor G-binding protein [Bacillus sp. AFS055030]
MEPFIRTEQYNFIKHQLQVLTNGHSTVNDKTVLNALHSLVNDKILSLFPELTEDQLLLFSPISTIKNSDQADALLNRLKSYVIPFKEVSEQSIKKLFPKAKKLKLPLLQTIDLVETTYIGWDDLGSNSKFIVTYLNDKLIGLQGTFSPMKKRGNCTICNKYSDLGLFMTKTKGRIEGTFTQRGNYICKDSQICNQNIMSLDKLHDFIMLVK